MKRWVFLGFLLLSGTVVHAQSKQTLFRCNDQRHVITLSLNTTGQSVEGPACAQITVNALRYTADFSKTVTYSPGPSLTTVFPSSWSPGGAAPKATLSNLDDQFKAYWTEIQQLAGVLIPLESRNRATGAKVDRYLTELKALVVQSDEVLATSGPSGVLAVVNDPAKKTQMDAMLTDAPLAWQTTDEIVMKLQKLQADLNSLPLQFPTNTGAISGDPCSDTSIKQLGWNDWSTKCRDAQYKLAQSTLTTLLTEAHQWTSDGDKAAQFAKKVGIIQYWKNTIDGLSKDSFTRQAEVRCGVLFNRNAQTVLKLLLADRTSIFDGQLPQPQTKDGLLTVMCSSPFSVSAGAAFNTTRNRQFAIVQSAPATGGTMSVHTFGVTSDSRVNPYPIAIAHARLHDWDDNRYAIHFSFGIGVSIKGQQSGGSNPEFLTGLSFSFLRTIFLTGGLDVAKQSELIGGFKVGDTVPTDITSPPVSSSYKPGFGFAITFTKP